MQTLRTGVFAVALLAGLSCALFACQKDDKNKAKPITQLGSGAALQANSGSAAMQLPGIDLDSKDILSRTDVAPLVFVKHVLIGWKGAGGSDPRSENRSNEDAAKLAKDVMAKIKANPAGVDAIVSEHSEDPGSAKSGEPYEVKSETPFVPEFKNLALRLKDNEVGIVKTNFGYHVMLRVPKPPPDPLESAAILARPAPADGASIFIQHIMITFQKAGKAEADRRAKDVMARVGKEDFGKLAAEASELPDGKDQKAIEINTKTPGLPDNFKNLAMRLKLEEVGIAKSQGGWHIIKRVPEPPPDPLQSNDILKRAPEKGIAHVRHIMIGWKGTGIGDPRAEKREKKDADKLAKDLLAKAKKGDDFPKLMKEHSEEKGSADTGRMYEVTADGRMPDSFKNLALRLKVNEVGLVLGEAGWHVMKRFAAPPPDNLESAAILKRAPTTKKAKVKHILLGWTEVHGSDPRGVKRTRADLEKLVKETVAKLAKGDKIEPLMKELSEDPGSAADGKSYDVEPQSSLVPPFKNLSLRLNLNEVGVVKTDYGIHIIQRTE